MRDMDIAEFLLARIAEDESAARAAGLEPWQVIASDVHLTGENANAAVAVGPWGSPIGPAAIHIVRHQPLNVLAECEAKRGGSWRSRRTPRTWTTRSGQTGGCRPTRVTTTPRCGERILRALALPYADHPDYESEWSPLAATPSG